MRALPILVASSVLLAACGFELRGTGSVMPANVDSLYVDAPEELRREVDVFLQGTKVTMPASREAADIALTLAAPRYDRRVLSVDARTGKEREIELSYTLTASAVDRDGKTLIAPQPVTLQRDYVFDARAVIGATTEETTLRSEMRRAAVERVLHQLRVAAASGG